MYNIHTSTNKNHTEVSLNIPESLIVRKRHSNRLNVEVRKLERQDFRVAREVSVSYFRKENQVMYCSALSAESTHVLTNFDDIVLVGEPNGVGLSAS